MSKIAGSFNPNTASWMPLTLTDCMAVDYMGGVNPLLSGVSADSPQDTRLSRLSRIGKIFRYGFLPIIHVTITRINTINEVKE